MLLHRHGSRPVRLALLTASLPLQTLSTTWKTGWKTFAQPSWMPVLCLRLQARLLRLLLAAACPAGTVGQHTQLATPRAALAVELRLADEGLCWVSLATRVSAAPEMRLERVAVPVSISDGRYHAHVPHRDCASLLLLRLFACAVPPLATLNLQRMRLTCEQSSPLSTESSVTAWGPSASLSLQRRAMAWPRCSFVSLQR